LHGRGVRALWKIPCTSHFAQTNQSIIVWLSLMCGYPGILSVSAFAPGPYCYPQEEQNTHLSDLIINTGFMFTFYMVDREDWAYIRIQFWNKSASERTRLFPPFGEEERLMRETFTKSQSQQCLLGLRPSLNISYLVCFISHSSIIMYIYFHIIL
jgi:hypothetical protein